MTNSSTCEITPSVNGRSDKPVVIFDSVFLTVLSFFLSILNRSNFDHHLRCGGWLNFEFS